MPPPSPPGFFTVFLPPRNSVERFSVPYLATRICALCAGVSLSFFFLPTCPSLSFLIGQQSAGIPLPPQPIKLARTFWPRFYFNSSESAPGNPFPLSVDSEDSCPSDAGVPFPTVRVSMNSLDEIPFSYDGGFLFPRFFVVHLFRRQCLRPRY